MGWEIFFGQKKNRKEKRKKKKDTSTQIPALKKVKTVTSPTF